MNFSKQRFLNFARYDLTINRTFYRNLVLATIIGALGICTLGFTARYSMWSGTVALTLNDPEEMNEAAYNMAMESTGDTVSTLPFEHYNNTTITVMLLAEFLGIMAIIFAGCWAHNMRTKQGRITELTLPATNLEKYLWHTGLMIGGGLLLCLASLLLADAFNALLTLIAYSADGGVVSLTAQFFNLVFMDSSSFIWQPFMSFASEPNFTTFLIKSLIAISMLLTIAIYHFGNAVKYKFNIILTYIILYVIGIVLMIIFLTGMATIANFLDLRGLQAEEILDTAEIAFYVIYAIMLLLIIILPVKSFHLYSKAQITTKTNK